METILNPLGAFAVQMATLLFAVAAVITALKSVQKMGELKTEVNSRLSKLLEETGNAAFAKGVLHGEQKQRERHNAAAAAKLAVDTEKSTNEPKPAETKAADPTP